MINWREIITYGFCLFIAQVSFGFAVGFFFPHVGVPFHAGDIASFLVCLAIFAHLASRHSSRPFFHACLALGFYYALSLPFDATIWALLGGVPISLMVQELLSLIAAMLAGVGLSYVLRRKAAQHEA